MTRSPETSKFYTLQEVAQILRVTRTSVYSYVWNKRLRATKLAKEWRVSEEDLQDFLRKGQNTQP